MSSNMMIGWQLLLALIIVAGMASGLATAGRAFLVTGANKGQGYALCERILTEHDDTSVFLCSRDVDRGMAAASRLGHSDRVHVIQLDVTEDHSVEAAVKQVQECLGKDRYLQGLVSNAGILWGESLSDLLEVCAIGVRRVLDAFLPLMDPDGGRIIVVSSGLGPLMHQYSEYGDILQSAKDWETLSNLMSKCLAVKGGPAEFEAIGFSGGAFAETAPDFHMYGLAKMFGDAYMLSLAREHPNLNINSCDPGLVYTDLIDKIPRYTGKPIEETNAKTPAEGVEVHMRLLFGGLDDGVEGSGLFYAMNKEGKLTSGPIDKRPDV